MYANQNPERMLREAGEAEQFELLQATVHRAYEKTVFYRRRLEEYRVSPVEIEILADIKKLPFTTRSDLVKTSPLDFLTLPVKKTVRLRLQEKSNILRAGTEADVAHNIELTRRGLAAGGIKPGSVLAIVGGHPEGAVDDVQHAAESLGAAVVSLGGDFVRAVELIEQLGIDTVIGDPTRILQLIVTAQASGREMENLPLRACFCLNDAIQNPIGKFLYCLLSIHVFAGGTFRQYAGGGVILGFGVGGNGFSSVGCNNTLNSFALALASRLRELGQSLGSLFFCHAQRSCRDWKQRMNFFATVKFRASR